jgi:pseudomonalisin
MGSIAARLARIVVIGAVVAAAPAMAGDWVATKVHAVQIKPGIVLSPVAADKPLQVAVMLQPRNKAELDALAASGKTLTPAQFLARFSPTAADTRAVANYLRHSGFSNVSVATNRLVITAGTSAGAAQSAFHTHLSQFTYQGKNYFANTRDVSVPARLGATVLGVYGLNNVAVHSTDAGVPDVTLLFGGLTPQQLQEAYGAAGQPDASQTSIAIFAFGDMAPVVSHLRTYETEYGLPAVSVVEVKTIPGGAYTDRSGEGEWDMDVQTSTGIAGNVKELVIYNGDDFANDANWLANFNRFVTDNRAKAGSFSAGGCEELEWALAFTDALDVILEAAVVNGQTLFFSTGDTGSTCYNLATGPVGGTNGVPLSGIPGQTYPASSPWGMAVGGTTLLLDSSDDSRTAEAAWNAGGGGNSLVYNGVLAAAAPAWQVGVVPGANLGVRGVPDVAMDADFLVSGANVVSETGEGASGGTSLSSPLALGAWARVESAHCNALPFAAPRLYALSPGLAKAVPGFYDIVAGGNGFYVATPGWDFTTGLGAINVAALNPLLGSTSCAATR